MSTRRESTWSSDEPFARSSSADLLDLVRSAEDEARLALRRRADDVVDVDDEAIDAPATLPPMPAAVVERRGWPPAAGIAVLFALALGALALIAR